MKLFSDQVSIAFSGSAMKCLVSTLYISGRVGESQVVLAVCAIPGRLLTGWHMYDM